MSFGKSLLIAVGATGTSMTAVVVAGLLTNSGPFAIGPDAPRDTAEAPAPAELRTVVMAPVALDPGGYSLTGPEHGDEVFVSVEMVMRRAQGRELACKLMPRLKAAILRDLGPRVWSRPKALPLDEDDVNLFVRDRFDHALGGNAVQQVSVRFSDRPPPGHRANCVEALHGGWQAWITKARRHVRETVK